MMEHNLRLVVYIARKFENTGADADDLVSVGTIGLIKAINSFQAGQKYQAGDVCFAVHRERDPHVSAKIGAPSSSEVSFDEPLNTDWEGNELLLSDVLGTDSDTVYKDIETGVEKGTAARRRLKKLPERDQQDHVSAFRARTAGMK